MYGGRIQCSYCKEHDETLQHLVQCNKYPKDFKKYEDQIDMINIEEAIYESHEMEKLKNIAKIINEMTTDLEEKCQIDNDGSKEKVKMNVMEIDERAGYDTFCPQPSNPSSPNLILPLTGLNRQIFLPCEVIRNEEGCDRTTTVAGSV